jgi:hypothetical protein
VSGALLGLTLLAVAWLVIWVGKDHSQPSTTWWPFEMRDLTPKKDPGFVIGQVRTPRRIGAGKPVKRPWRRSDS